MSSTETRPRRRKRLLSVFLIIVAGIIVGIIALILKAIEIVTILSAIFSASFAFLGLLLVLLEEESQPMSSTTIPPTDTAITKQSQENSNLELEGITPETLCIGGVKGALIIYTDSKLLGSTISLIPGFNSTNTKAEAFERVVRRRTKNGRTVFAAIFPEVYQGKYTLFLEVRGLEEKVNIKAGEVKVVDWRQSTLRHSTRQQ